MQKTRPFIAILLLTVYFLTVLFPAGDFSLVASERLSKGCKKEYAINDTNNLQNIFTNSFNTSGDNNANIPHTQLLTLCNPPVMYVVSSPIEVLPKTSLQEPAYALFSASLYSFLLKEIDPEPPKNAFC